MKICHLHFQKETYGQRTKSPPSCNSSDIDFGMASNQFELSPPYCIFVANLVIFPDMEQLGQNGAVKMDYKPFYI